MNIEIKNSIGSNILSKENISLTSEEDMKLKQANIQGKNITINSKKDILIESGVSTLDSKRSSQSLNGEINLLTGQFNIGSGVTKDKSEERSHTNSQIYGENIAIKSKDLSVKGGNIEADKVDIEAKNLHIESMQDKANSKHQALNISVGSSSVGGGIEYGKYEKEWVNKQSSIIGREKMEIDVAEKTNIIGAVIGGADTTLKTKELEYSNIEDKEKGYNVGISANANMGITNVYNETNPNNPNKQLNISKSGSASYDAVDREQINRATKGNIQYYAALHYIEDKYGVGALEHIKTKKYTSAGSPLNAVDLISYLKNKKIIENPNVDNIIIKNDKLDLVANVAGFNGTSIIARDPAMREKIEAKEKYRIKYDIWDPHSHYSQGSEANSHVEYSSWQKPLIYSDKILKMMNMKDYFKKREDIEINKGAKKNEEIN